MRSGTRGSSASDAGLRKTLGFHLWPLEIRKELWPDPESNPETPSAMSILGRSWILARSRCNPVRALSAIESGLRLG